MSSKRKMMEKEEAPLQKGNKELENLEEEVARLREENFRLRDCLGAIPAARARSTKRKSTILILSGLLVALIHLSGFQTFQGQYEKVWQEKA
jgi:hypothetical protein